jgi:hypothetical protein
MGTRHVNRWLLAVALALHPGLAAAQASHVSLVIDQRGVTLDAREATLGEILAEWTRVGGIRVVAADRLADRPVTLQFTNVSEREAFDILLRDIGGYVLGARGPGNLGASQFGTLVLVSASGPVSSAQPNPGRFNPAATAAIRPLVPNPVPVAEAFQTQNVPDGDDASDLEGDADAGASTPGKPVDRRPNLRTPISRPSTAPDAQNPFGKAGTSTTPGTIITGAPPPGFVYPANPNEATGGETPPGRRPQ